MSSAPRRAASSRSGSSRRAAPRRNARANVMLIAVVLIVIAFAGFLTYLKQQNHGGLATTTGAGAPAATAPAASAAAAVATTGSAVKPKYDFYQDRTEPPTAATAPAQTNTEATLQPSAATAATPPAAASANTNAAPAASTITLLSPNARDNAPRTPPSPAASALSGFVVQAGAFSQYADADRLNARLLLLGIRPRIERGVVDNNEIHRVRIGPFDTRAQAKTVQRTLDKNQISSYVLQLK